MPTLYTQRQIIVVTAAVAATLNAHAKLVDTVGGEKTFTAGLSPTGTLPATHFWCNWQMQPGEKSALTTLVTGLPAATQLGVTTFVLDSVDPAVAKPTPQTVL